LTNSSSGITFVKDANGGVQINFNPDLFKRIQAQGVHSAVPIIINVSTMSTAQVRPLLGISVN